MKVSAEIDKSKSKQSAKILKLIQSPFGTFAEYLTEAEIFLKKMRDLPGLSGKLRMKVKGLATTDGKHPEKQFDILAEMSFRRESQEKRIKNFIDFLMAKFKWNVSSKREKSFHKGTFGKS